MEQLIKDVVLEVSAPHYAVSEADRALYEEKFGGVDEDYYTEYDAEYDAEYGVEEDQLLGYDAGSNSDLAAAIVHRLHTQGGIESERKAFKAVKKKLETYPEVEVNGQKHNSFDGPVEVFAHEIAETIRESQKGLISKLLRR